MPSPDDQPELLEQINAEWDAWRRWGAAYLYGAESLPELPYQATKHHVSGWVGVPASLMHIALVMLGGFARKTNLNRLRIWAAENEIAFDHL